MVAVGHFLRQPCLHTDNVSASWSAVSTRPGHQCPTSSKHSWKLQVLLSPAVVGTVGRLMGNILGRPEDKGLLRTVEPSYPPNHEISSALRSLWLLRCLLLHLSAVDVWSKSCPFWVNIWAGYNSRGKCLILLSVISFPLLDTNMTLTGQMACNRHHFRKTKCLRTIIYKDLLTQEQKLD